MKAVASSALRFLILNSSMSATGATFCSSASSSTGFVTQKSGNCRVGSECPPTGLWGTRMFTCSLSRADAVTQLMRPSAPRAAETQHACACGSACALRNRKSLARSQLRRSSRRAVEPHLDSVRHGAAHLRMHASIAIVHRLHTSVVQVPHAPTERCSAGQVLDQVLIERLAQFVRDAQGSGCPDVLSNRRLVATSTNICVGGSPAHVKAKRVQPGIQ